MAELFHGGRADRFWVLCVFLFGQSGLVHEHVGFALTAGGLSDVAAQLPGGPLTDAVRRKRLLVAIGILMTAASAILLALWPNFPIVLVAEILHGATGGIIGPAIGAISLGLVGRGAMSSRVGRNQRFDAAGNALTAASLGLTAQWFSKSSIFLSSHCSPSPPLWR